jgi:creatinine amidohydrolase/Fe(II)-dependent formamide hydrolase-like protein
MDLAGDLGEQKFRWILVVHDHGDPAHNQALDQAADYFHDAYGGTLLHLFGLTEVQNCYDIMPQLLSKKATEEDGLTVHAGAEEHSEILFLHPELVDPSVKDAPPVTGTSFDDLYHAAETAAWPGYFGAPARASANTTGKSARNNSNGCAQRGSNSYSRLVSAGPRRGRLRHTAFDTKSANSALVISSLPARSSA